MQSTKQESPIPTPVLDSNFTIPSEAYEKSGSMQENSMHINDELYEEADEKMDTQENSNNYGEQILEKSIQNTTIKVEDWIDTMKANEENIK